MKTGVLGEFEQADALLDAIRELRRRGYRRLDAFTPYPVKGLEEALGLPRSPLTWMVLPFAMFGVGGGYFVQWWCNGYDYPLNVGGRPLHSAPAFIPITFEMGVLTASIVAVLVCLYLTGLPRLHLPLYEAPGFGRATLDRFLIGIDDADPSFSAIQAEADLRAVGATSVVFARRHEEP